MENRKELTSRIIYLLLSLIILFNSCEKETEPNAWVISNFSGTYKNVEYSENLIGEFTTGTYEENEIPDDLKQLQYGRIEIDFRYNGGGLNYFAPLFYYGSMNKDTADDAVEEPLFHLAVEIGHYNVIPFPVEYLFYTICTFNQPQYCRDTYVPTLTGGINTVIIDKKPEGMILQMRRGNNITNIFPHAFFPDSAQMFFNDVTSYTDHFRGDSLKMVLMVGKGFAGIDKGVHELNGQVTGMRVFKYSITNSDTGYELKQVRNQHTENQKVVYIPHDLLNGIDKFIRMDYEFYPYNFISGELIPGGAMQNGKSLKMPNNAAATCYFSSKDIGFYCVTIQTLDKDDNILRTSTTPFGLWVYPEEWAFDFY